MRAIFGLVLLLSACEPKETPPPGALTKTGDLVATIDGETVTQDMVDAVTRRVPPEQLAELKKDEAQYGQFLERIYLGQALYKRAIDQGIAKDPELTKVIAMAEREIVASELLEKVAKDGLTEEKVKESYDKQAKYARPQAKLQHAMFTDEAKAVEAIAALKAGGDFATVVAGLGGQAPNGGDLGWVSKGQLIPDIETPAFSANAGDVVGPIQASFGFVVVKVNEKRDKTPLEEVRAEVEEALKREVIDEYINKIKGEMKVVKPGDKPAEGEAKPAEGEAKPAEGEAKPAEGGGH